MKYAFILAELMTYALSIVCRVLGVTQSGFHAWHGRAPSKRAQERGALKASISDVFDAHRGRYGAPRIYRTLCAQDGYTFSINRIKALMQAMGLRAKAGKKYKVTTDSAHALPVAPNRLGQNFSCDPSVDAKSRAKAPDQSSPRSPMCGYRRVALCVGRSGPVDAQNRRLGHGGTEMTRQLVLEALQMANATRKSPPGVIFHSDCGCQYACRSAALETVMTTRPWRVSGIC